MGIFGPEPLSDEERADQAMDRVVSVSQTIGELKERLVENAEEFAENKNRIIAKLDSAEQIVQREVQRHGG